MFIQLIKQVHKFILKAINITSDKIATEKKIITLVKISFFKESSVKDFLKNLLKKIVKSTLISAKKIAKTTVPLEISLK